MAIEIKRSFIGDAERYLFDFKVCTYAKGWAQFDTRQDASYYGNWINPTTRELLSFAEGDVARTTCDTDEEFVAEVTRAAEWHLANDGKRPGIDPGLGDTMRAHFERLGLGAWLHGAVAAEGVS